MTNARYNQVQYRGRTFRAGIILPGMRSLNIIEKLFHAEIDARATRRLWWSLGREPSTSAQQHLQRLLLES